VEDDPALELARSFSEVASALWEKAEPGSVLDRIVRLCVATIPACEHAGITVVDGGHITSPASSDEIHYIVDAIQAETGEGPCVDAIREHETFYTGRLASDDRWPRFSRRANAVTGIESILSLRLFVKEETLGTLNLYSSRPDSFDARDTGIAAVFATHASVAWSASQTMIDLQTGLDTRQLIGEATGILMAREHLTSPEAFDILRRASQRLNVKLRDIALDVVKPPDGTGQHPDP
jgi:transcriptional regulator with GAF, ATPase, and Fis domain